MKAKKTSWEKEFEKEFVHRDKDFGQEYTGGTPSLIKAFIRQVRQEAYQEGIEEAIEFMKGKVIDMPVGSGVPLVVKEAQVIGWLTKEKK